jgi:hypothetical protein
MLFAASGTELAPMLVLNCSTFVPVALRLVSIRQWQRVAVAVFVEDVWWG